MRNIFEEPLEKLNPVCEKCEGSHKTSQHDAVQQEKGLDLGPICKECRGSHETSEHDSAGSDK